MIFKRRTKDPIADFWAWWAPARPRAELLIGGASDDAFVAEIGDRVRAISPDLDWEFAAGQKDHKGQGSEHLLVVSGAGDPELRSLAERWRRSGPVPDAVFGYASSRQGRADALAGARLTIAGRTLDLSEMRFAVVEEEYEIHVQVWHPQFPDLPADARRQLTYLALGWLLGEDNVEIWVGEIAEATAPPAEPMTGPEVAALVEAMRPEPGEERWASLTGERAGRPVMGMTQVPLRPARWPGHDLHVRVDVPYGKTQENGFPDQATLDALHELDDHLIRHADGAVVVAHETSAGVRTTHLYADRQAAAEALRSLVTAWPQGKVRVTVKADPHWRNVDHLT